MCKFAGIVNTYLLCPCNIMCYYTTDVSNMELTLWSWAIRPMHTKTQGLTRMSCLWVNCVRRIWNNSSMRLCLALQLADYPLVFLQLPFYLWPNEVTIYYLIISKPRLHIIIMLATWWHVMLNLDILTQTVTITLIYKNLTNRWNISAFQLVNILWCTNVYGVHWSMIGCCASNGVLSHTATVWLSVRTLHFLKCSLTYLLT